MFESTAVWMEDKVYDDINDYRNYLPRVGQALDAAAHAVQLAATRATATSRSTATSSSTAGSTSASAPTRSAARGRSRSRRATGRVVRARRLRAGAAASRARTSSTSSRSSRPRPPSGASANSFFEEGDTFPDMARALNGAALPPQNVTGERNDFVEGGARPHRLRAVQRRPARRAAADARRHAAAAASPARSRSSAAPATRSAAGGRGDQAPAARRPRPGHARERVELLARHRGDRQRGRRAERLLAAARRLGLARRRRADHARAQRLHEGEASGACAQGSSSRRGHVHRGGRRASRASSVKLVGPNGRSVRVALAQSQNGRIVTLRPTRRLAPGRRYTVKLSSAITDPARQPAAVVVAHASASRALAR